MAPEPSGPNRALQRKSGTRIRTVAHHRTEIMRLLGVHDTARLPGERGGDCGMTGTKRFLDSRELELRLRIGEGHLDFVRRDTGERLLARAERVQQEAEARQRETQARLAAEAEVARLRAELARRGPSAE